MVEKIQKYEKCQEKKMKTGKKSLFASLGVVNVQNATPPHCCCRVRWEPANSSISLNPRVKL